MPRNRSGFAPRQSRYLIYEISTMDAKKYIQNKIDLVVKSMRQKGGYQIPNIPINLISVNTGENFKPFAISLPMSADESYYVNPEQPEEDENVNPIFMPEYDDEDCEMIKARILGPIYNALKAYKYNKADKEMISSQEFRSKHGISRNKAKNFRDFVNPRVIPIEGRSGEMQFNIILLLDPIRVFHDMLTDADNPNINFRITIEEFKEMKFGVFNHTVKWYRYKNNNDNAPNIAESIQAAVTGDPVRRHKGNNNRNHHKKKHNYDDNFRNMRRNRY